MTTSLSALGRRIRAALSRNPLVHLATVAWRHAADSRRLVLLYLFSSVVGNLIWIAGPLMIATILDAVQRLSGTELLRTSLLCALGYFSIGFGGWLFHGPSRVLERTLAHVIRTTFQSTLLRKVTLLPMKWHQRHHSGETIDK
jgi:ATP-binding cassette subfamily B protein